MNDMIIADTTISIAIIMKLSLLVSVSFFIPANIRNKMVFYNIPIVKKRKSLGVSLQSLFAHSEHIKQKRKKNGWFYIIASLLLESSS
jgi:hypothetical protein